MSDYLIWIPLLPFLGFLVNGLLGSRIGDRGASWVGCLAPISAFIVTVNAFLALGETGLRQDVFVWMTIEGGFEANFTLLFDNLSAVMCLVITGVGSLIHLYSTGYMKGDSGYTRYFAYLNLFTAFMLVLVLGDNLLLLFVGWEGVGLCSYLLIGFWHTDHANSSAGQKAFIVNRIGDFGFLLGMFLIYMTFDSLNPSTICAAVGDANFMATVPDGRITAITLLLFVGATGKSAQIPLYTWLPDAMAGPTPVSALIHAATMVTSGVYMCCRLAPLFYASPTTMGVIAVIGGATALFAALIALSQNDIKKVLAYSTVSQLGYMFLAVGLGAFGAAMFHLVTHAFFKALLFLGSGSVIHAMHHEQDMRKMGGLKNKLPTTYWTFLAGTLAISGVPLLSGFVSKDAILYAAFHHMHDGGVGAKLLWAAAWLTAGLTAFYMFRCVAMTFWGESRVDKEVEPHVHEGGGWMSVALIVLAVLSIAGGLGGLPPIWGVGNYIGDFVESIYPGQWLFGMRHLEGAELEAHHAAELTSMLLSVVVAGAGIAAAVLLYGKRKGLIDSFVNSGIGRLLHTASSNKFYVDELYQAVFVIPFSMISYVMWAVVDRLLIDGLLVSGSAHTTRFVAEQFRRMQSGFIPAYLLTFSCGALALLLILMTLLRQ